MTYFQNQVRAASAGLKTAQQNLANGSVPGSTADLHALTQASRVAKSRLTTATRAYNQAALNLAASRGEQQIFKVIDPIQGPAKPVAKKKKSLFALFAGLFVGGLLSFFGIVFVSGREQRAAEADGVVDWSHDGAPAEPAVAATNGSAGTPHIPVTEDTGA
jgi:hypothetical protein